MAGGWRVEAATRRGTRARARVLPRAAGGGEPEPVSAREPWRLVGRDAGRRACAGERHGRSGGRVPAGEGPAATWERRRARGCPRRRGRARGRDRDGARHRGERAARAACRCWSRTTSARSDCSDHLRIADSGRLPSALRRHGDHAPQRGGSGGDRQGQHGRVRDGLLHRVQLLRADAESRTISARVPGGSSGGPAAAVAYGLCPLVARLRHRRLGAPARRLLRRVRPQAHRTGGSRATGWWRSARRSTRSAIFARHAGDVALTYAGARRARSLRRHARGSAAAPDVSGWDRGRAGPHASAGPPTCGGRAWTREIGRRASESAAQALERGRGEARHVRLPARRVTRSPPTTWSRPPRPARTSRASTACATARAIPDSARRAARSTRARAARVSAPRCSAASCSAPMRSRPAITTPTTSPRSGRAPVSAASTRRPSRAATSCCCRRRPRCRSSSGEKTEDPLAMYLQRHLHHRRQPRRHPGLTVPVGLTAGPRRIRRHAAAARGPAPRPRRLASRRCSPPAARIEVEGDRAKLDASPRDGVRMAYRSGNRARVPHPAQHPQQDVLRLPGRVRRRAQRQRVPGVPRAARDAPGREPRRDRRRASARSCARLRRSRARACSRASTTSIPTCRRTTRSRSTTGRCARAARCRSGSARRPAAFELTRVHAEEDTGKSFHPERHGDRQVSRVDFNRAGVPLLELVTQPVFRDPAECAAFLTALRRLVRWLGISDGDMEKGQLRCDANVSIRRAGQTTLGTKTELKNLNSIKRRREGTRPPRSRASARGRVAAAAIRAGDACSTTPTTTSLRSCAPRSTRTTTATSPSPTCRCSRVDAAWLAAARDAAARAAVGARRAAGDPVWTAGIRRRHPVRRARAGGLPRGGGVECRSQAGQQLDHDRGASRSEGARLDGWRPGRTRCRRRGSRDLLARVARRELPGPLAKQVLGVDEPTSRATWPSCCGGTTSRCRRRPMTWRP